MSHLVAALFRDPVRAHQALQALLERGHIPDRITFVARHEGREISSISGFRTLEPHEDFDAPLKPLNLPPEDRRALLHGLRSGHALVAVSVDKAGLDEAIRTLEMFDPIDLDRSSREWMEAAPAPSGTDVAGMGSVGAPAEGTTGTADLPGMNNLAERPDLFGPEDAEGVGAAKAREKPDLAEELGRGTMRREINRAGRVWAYALE